MCYASTNVFLESTKAAPTSTSLSLASMVSSGQSLSMHPAPVSDLQHERSMCIMRANYPRRGGLFANYGPLEIPKNVCCVFFLPSHFPRTLPAPAA